MDLGDIDFNFWLFFAGLGIFLFGMYHLEKGLKGLAGKSFRRMLQRFTNRSWKGVLTGASVTAIVQSSSLVDLLVVAFLGAGMMNLQHSLGVVFGANIGTTATAWIVATLGFKLNIASLSLPFLAIGTLSYLMLDSRPVLKNMGSFLIGFGLLFLGLDYMKNTVDAVSGQINLSEFRGMSLFVFLLIGLVITALIQSSSATIVIVLSALSAGLIDIYQSVALVIGANIGTTSTLLIASIKGSADKKRLAIANIMFKLVAASISFIFLRQMVDISLKYLHITDPLMELVFLHTTINVIGLLIFFPFIKPLSKLLQLFFKKKSKQSESLYITNAQPEVPDIAIAALENEVERVFQLSLDFIKECLMISNNGKTKTGTWTKVFKAELNPLLKYEHLKTLEDEITIFYKQIQEQTLTEVDSAKLSAQMIRLRSMIYAAKNIKDVLQNIKQIDECDDNLTNGIWQRIQEFSKDKTDALATKELIALLQANGNNWHVEFERFYTDTVNYLYQNIDTVSQLKVPISTVTNLIRKSISSLEELYVAATTR